MGTKRKTDWRDYTPFIIPACWLLGLAVATILLDRYTPAAISLVAVGAGLIAARTVTQFDKTEQPAATSQQVRLAEGLFAVSALIAVASLKSVPTTAYGVAGALVVGSIVVGGRYLGRRHQKWQPTTTVFGLLVDSWGRLPGRRLAVAILTASIVLGGALNMYVRFGPLVGVVLAMVAGRAYWSKVKGDAETRRAVEYAVAGTWTGGAPGEPWSTMQERLRRAPIEIELDDDGQPVQLTGPLPQNWDSAGGDGKTTDLTSRLKRWVPMSGDWTVDFDESARTFVITPLSLPTMCHYPGDNQPWNRFPLGLRADGTEAVWDVLFAPHILIAGPTGSGKSVAQRMVVFHALQHPEWRILGIDLKRVEMSWLTKYSQVLQVAKTLEDAVKMLRTLKENCDLRYTEMDEAGVNHFKDLPNPPNPILMMIDEMTNLMAMESVKTEEGKEIDLLHGEAVSLIKYLARTSRAAGIFLALATQRPDAQVLGGGELKSNLDCRVAAGRMDKTPSGMVLDSPDAEKLPKIKGRGLVRNGGDLDLYQGYFAEQSWYDSWLAETGGHVANAYRAAGDESARLMVLQRAIESGQMMDRDAQACGFDNVEAVNQHLSANSQAVKEALLLETLVRKPPAKTVAPAESISTGTQNPDGAGDATGQDTVTPAPSAHGNVNPVAADGPGERLESLPKGEAGVFLKDLIGMAAAKQKIETLRNRVAHELVLKERGIGDGVVRPGHYRLEGPSGVGKTILAQVMGSLLRDAGVLRSGHVIVVTGQNLKGQYLGQSAPIVEAVVKSAIGGVLLVDEAYGMGTDAFGKEALATLMVLAETHLPDLCILLAGYPREMNELIHGPEANSGLASRFSKVIEFPAYSVEELVLIGEKMVKDESRILNADAKGALADLMARQDLTSRSWGNARTVRDLVDAAIERQSDRLASTPNASALSTATLVSLTAEDILGAWAASPTGGGGSGKNVTTSTPDYTPTYEEEFGSDDFGPSSHHGSLPNDVADCFNHGPVGPPVDDDGNPLTPEVKVDPVTPPAGTPEMDDWFSSFPDEAV